MERGRAWVLCGRVAPAVPFSADTEDGVACRLPCAQSLSFLAKPFCP